jgi:hypothetical protein
MERLDDRTGAAHLTLGSKVLNDDKCQFQSHTFVIV